MTISNKELRAYLNPNIGNITFGGFFIGFILLQLLTMLAGTFIRTLPVFVCIYLVIAIVWYAQRHYFYIALNIENQTLYGTKFFGFGRQIPIASIIRLGSRGMFLGAQKTLTITFLKNKGKSSTVLFGSPSSLDSVQFHKILDKLVELNPRLEIPCELR